jgi:hypothetical protein
MATSDDVEQAKMTDNQEKAPPPLCTAVCVTVSGFLSLFLGI